jgi:hypothetical protein
MKSGHSKSISQAKDFGINKHKNKLKGVEKYVWQPSFYTRLFARWGYQWGDFPHGIRSLLLR